ncbi:MAG: ABC transporter ATP-binding protein [Alphaproteobacteria bacterium]|nr:ABC transporter ATP-binding protein [Alphaproteobacteria bacterium]
MLSATDLAFSYVDGEPILGGAAVRIANGEFVALLGPSGCGKSTLLRLLAGLETPNKGSVQWSLDRTLRPGIVFQDAALMPWATVKENVLLPHKLSGAELAVPNVDELLAAVDLAGLNDRYPAALSGGQRMRVSIARALSASPDILFMDEPFAALDEILRFQMNDLMLQLKAEKGFGGLFVTHSLYEAAYLADRILVMGNGKIIGEISPELDRGQRAEAVRTSKQYLDAVSKIAALLATGRRENG